MEGLCKIPEIKTEICKYFPLLDFIPSSTSILFSGRDYFYNSGNRVDKNKTFTWESSHLKTFKSTLVFSCGKKETLVTTQDDFITCPSSVFARFIDMLSTGWEVMVMQRKQLLCTLWGRFARACFFVKRQTNHRFEAISCIRANRGKTHWTQQTRQFAYSDRFNYVAKVYN